MARKPLDEVRLQREWTFPEFARVLGRSKFYVHDRAEATGPDGGVVHLPVGDVPYIVDTFRGERRLILACDYETVEARRRNVIEQGGGQ